jgi:glycosyltransferase 2 family protein
MLKKLPLSSIFGLLLLALSIWAITNQLGEYNYCDVINSLKAIPTQRLSLAIWLTALGYLVMIPYDILGFYYIGHFFTWSKIAFTNFISSVFSNTIGFALLTGSTIRYRFYKSWGVSPLGINRCSRFTGIV